jgi:hypothetical protein
MLPPSALGDVLDTAADFSRSLWDERDILFYLDLDYHNQDIPGEAFAHPIETFAAIEPVYRATRVLLRCFGIRALATISGRGYHFVGRVSRQSAVAAALPALCHEPPGWWPGYEQRRLAWMPPKMPEQDARAYVGLGMVTEHLAHLIQRRAALTAKLPVVFNGTAVGSGRMSRESVSIDLSHFGDPLDQRHVRCAYSAYQLHLHRPDIFGSWTAGSLSPFATVIRTNGPLLRIVDDGRTLEQGIRSATRSRAIMPDAADGLARLLQHYLSSRLAAFHERYSRDLASGCETPLPELDLAAVPACVAQPLIWPNDLLLRPEYIQHVTRYLLATGWPAARVALLVSSLYRTEGLWDAHWQRVDPRARAEFDVRVFAGLHAAGVDGALDFNCMSSQEKGLCPSGECPYDLRRQRAMLLERAAAI